MMIKSCQICLFLLVILTVICLRPFVLFSTHFIFDPGGINTNCPSCDSNNKDTSVLPLNIHQVHYNITHKDMSLDIKEAQQSWPRLNKEFNYTLWNESMVEKLLREEYPHLIDLYNSYSRWIHKVDMARYLIVHQYGGIYADTDIECVKNMLEVYMTFPVNTGVVMYYTSPFGVSNDFIIAKQKHPFMTAVIRGLSSSNRWYVLPFLTEMFSTGPIYLSARFWTFKDRYDMLVLEDTRYFLAHRTGASWHEADGKLLWWIFLNIELVIKWLVLCVGAFILLYLTCKILRLFLGNMKLGAVIPNISNSRRI